MSASFLGFVQLERGGGTKRTLIGHNWTRFPPFGEPVVPGVWSTRFWPGACVQATDRKLTAGARDPSQLGGEGFAGSGSGGVHPPDAHMLA